MAMNSQRFCLTKHFMPYSFHFSLASGVWLSVRQIEVGNSAWDWRCTGCDAVLWVRDSWSSRWGVAHRYTVCWQWYGCNSGWSNLSKQWISGHWSKCELAFGFHTCFWSVPTPDTRLHKFDAIWGPVDWRWYGMHIIFFLGNFLSFLRGYLPPASPVLNMTQAIFHSFWFLQLIPLH